MMTLSYTLSADWNAKSANIDWVHADEMTLRYEAFLGDQIILVDSADFSARWGWVPILDFAASMVAIAQRLSAGQMEAAFDFTDSGAILQFTRRGEMVVVSANYGKYHAQDSLEGIKSAARSYAQRVWRDAVDLHPELRFNRSFRIQPV